MIPRVTRLKGPLEWLGCPFEQFWQCLASLTSSTNCSQLENAKYLHYGGARLLSAIWLRSIMPASITWNDFDDFQSRRWNNEKLVLLGLFQCSGTKQSWVQNFPTNFLLTRIMHNCLAAAARWPLELLKWQQLTGYYHKSLGAVWTLIIPMTDSVAYFLQFIAKYLLLYNKLVHSLSWYSGLRMCAGIDCSGEIAAVKCGNYLDFSRRSGNRAEQRRREVERVPSQLTTTKVSD